MVDELDPNVHWGLGSLRIDWSQRFRIDWRKQCWFFRMVDELDPAIGRDRRVLGPRWNNRASSKADPRKHGPDRHSASTADDSAA